MTWREPLNDRLAELSRTPSPCVLGMGNRRRGDDGAGPLLCDRLAGRFGGTTIDAGVAPENHLERVVADAPRLVLVADAADFGGDPGEARILALDALVGAGVSTHACSPKMIGEYLTGRLPAAPVVLLLAIQPQHSDGPAVSPGVARCLDHLAQRLCEAWPAEDDP